MGLIKIYKKKKLLNGLIKEINALFNKNLINAKNNIDN